MSSQTNLTFELTFGDGTSSEKDTVTVTVLPLLTRASVSGTTLSVTFDTALKTSARPASSAFTVTATRGGASRTIAGTSSLVTISGKTVTATLSAAVAGDETLTVRYDKPASGAVLEDGAGTALPSFSNWPAGHVGDTTPPRVSSAGHQRSDPDPHLQRGAGRELGAGRTGQFPATIGGQWLLDRPGCPVSRQGGDADVRRSGAAGEPRRRGQPWTIGTSASRVGSHTPLRDLSGIAVAEFIGRSVTNNTPPAFSSAAVVGDALTVTFDGVLDPNSRPAADAFTVTVGGTEVDLAATNPVSISGSDGDADAG